MPNDPIKKDLEAIHGLFREALTLLSHCKSLLMMLPNWTVGVSKMLDQMTAFENRCIAVLTEISENSRGIK